jgi:hypothetical protein
VDLRDFDYSQPADAIRLIMEKLDGINQATASISLKGSLSLTHIMLLHARLGPGNRYPQLH